MEKKIFWMLFIVLGLVMDVALPLWWGLALTLPLAVFCWWVAYRQTRIAAKFPDGLPLKLVRTNR
jgi:uncharacterized membrane protein